MLVLLPERQVIIIQRKIRLFLIRKKNEKNLEVSQ